MARPQRNNVDYFPFYCEDGKKMYYLEETYGNDGFAVFMKILRELAKTNYHYLDLSKNTTLMFLSAKCKVSKEVLQAIINDLVELEKFDAELWKEYSIIWCQDFIDSIQEAYKNRSNNCVDRKGLMDILISLGIAKPPKPTAKPPKPKSENPVNPQTILDYSKGEDSKEDKGGKPPRTPKKKFIPPTLDQVKEYFLEKGYTEQAAKKAFDYYEAGDWVDSKGNSIKSWKQKMNGVWFTDEHAIKNGSKLSNSGEKKYKVMYDDNGIYHIHTEAKIKHHCELMRLKVIEKNEYHGN